MPTKTMGINQTQEYLQDILSLVGKGTEVILTQNDAPIARLIPFTAASAQPRVAELHPDAIWASDDFDNFLPEDFWIEEE